MANFSVQDSTVNFIADEEKFSAKAYWDYKQWSVGYGSGRMPNGRKVKEGDTVTLAEAKVMLRRDAQDAANAVNRLVTSALNQNQFDALTSFTYNLGEGNLSGSTLLKKVNANPSDTSAIRTEFLKWVNAGGERLDGLVKRRQREAALYASGRIEPASAVFF